MHVGSIGLHTFAYSAGRGLRLSLEEKARRLGKHWSLNLEEFDMKTWFCWWEAEEGRAEYKI